MQAFSAGGAAAATSPAARPASPPGPVLEAVAPGEKPKGPRRRRRAAPAPKAEGAGEREGDVVEVDDE